VTPWLTEQQIEDTAPQFFQDLGYDHVHGSIIAPDRESPVRASWADVLLLGRLKSAIHRLNGSPPPLASTTAVKP
jgi:type I restriction enzyme R subunit